MNMFSVLNTSHNSSFERVLEAEGNLFKMIQQYWYQHNFMTLPWWLLVLFTIFPPIIWWLLLDKTRIFEVMTYGLFLGTIATILDSIGSNMMLWTYPVRLSPYLFPQFYPYDVTLVIIPFMLIYQWVNDQKKFIIATIILAGFISYVAEPLAQLAGVYKMLTWRHIYSLFIYSLISIFTKYVMLFLKMKSVKK